MISSDMMKKIGNFLVRELWKRQQPHGLISCLYLLPLQNPLIRLHRRFWWRAASPLPRPLWLILEIYLFLRWTFWFAWRASWKVAATNASQVIDKHGLNRWQLMRQLLKLSLLHGMSPAQVLQFGLFLPGANYWEFVFESEAGAFHRWRDGKLLVAHMEILADKHKTLNILKELGILHTQTCVVLRKNDAEPDWSEFESSLFMKPRFGSGGKNCFYLKREPSGILDWKTYEEAPQNSDAAYFSWRKAAAQMDYLIQPCYENALPLKAIHSELITLRVLTKRSGTVWDVDFAYLEIPDGIRSYHFQAVDLMSGQLLQSTSEMIYVRDIWIDKGLAMLPHWQQAAASAVKAHEVLVPDIFSVAWDFILGEGGALLLEGNSTWGVGVLQQLRGPLLVNLSK